MLNRLQVALAVLLIAFGIAVTFAAVTTINNDPVARAGISRGHVG